MLIETVRSEPRFDINGCRSIQLPIQSVTDGVDFGYILEVRGNACQIDAAKSHLDGLLAIGAEEPMPQNPVALHLPEEFCDVDSEQPFDGRLGIEVTEDDSLKSLIVVDVLSGKK
ncbi:hypothetical protein P0R31_06340 [Bradyrhizobium yuanmingense]|uniref:hypothetical protein n=1 Tax=Bradyrhizobium yuanmingense TaxID=108015 RepID=UPI0023B98850|nr:hypothetical protein [Bradyrhizobium yuanmingense]MDF0516844.1 hypothetical protein [Bradyrhizobium yuanmingense]